MASYDDIPTEPPTASEPTRNVLVLVGAILVGLAIAGAVMPAIFRRLPSDMTRTRVLLNHLDKPSLQPTACVFGNSQVMNGVDSRRMGDSLPGTPEIWNLSSTGQDVFESFLYYQELPDSVETVVQCITATSLETELDISANKYNAFVMYGYRPDTETINVSDQFASSHARECLQTSNVAQRFESRWVLRSATNFGIRRLLRSDLSLDRAQQDLYSPRTYTRKVGKSQLEHLLREFDNPRKHGLRLAKHTTAFFTLLHEKFRQQGIEYVLVILPEHPRSPERKSVEFLADLDEYCRYLRDENNLSVVNCIDLLGEEHFIDQRHADEVGAELFTDRLVNELSTISRPSRQERPQP